MPWEAALEKRQKGKKPKSQKKKKKKRNTLILPACDTVDLKTSLEFLIA